jgi:ferredoxin-type protein NapH
VNITRLRKGTQVLMIILVILVPILNKKGITLLMGSLYSFAVGPIWITDPLIGFQTILTTMTADRTLLLSMVLPVVLALALGRVFCGWACPQNTVSELVDLAAAKFGLKRPFGKRATAFPRYVVLVAILIGTPLVGLPLASLLSAPGIISVQVAKLIYEGTLGLELGLIAMIVFFELLIVRRGWCNYVCPVGSFLGIFRVKRTLKVFFAEDGEHVCGKCLACADACGLGLNPMEAGIYPQCHNCGACISACEEMKAEKRPLVFKF